MSKDPNSTPSDFTPSAELKAIKDSVLKELQKTGEQIDTAKENKEKLLEQFKDFVDYSRQQQLEKFEHFQQLKELRDQAKQELKDAKAATASAKTKVEKDQALAKQQAAKQKAEKARTDYKEAKGATSEQQAKDQLAQLKKADQRKTPAEIEAERSVHDVYQELKDHPEFTKSLGFEQEYLMSTLEAWGLEKQADALWASKFKDERVIPELQKAAEKGGADIIDNLKKSCRSLIKEMTSDQMARCKVTTGYSAIKADEAIDKIEQDGADILFASSSRDSSKDLLDKSLYVFSTVCKNANFDELDAACKRPIPSQKLAEFQKITKLSKIAEAIKDPIEPDRARTSQKPPAQKGGGMSL